MSKKDMMWIAFPNGGIIPAAVMGEEDDRPVDAHQPVKVPSTYGEHLVHDRFAYETEAPKEKKRQAARQPDLDIAALDADITALSAKMEDETDLAAKSDLQKQLQELQGKRAAAKSSQP